MAEGAHFQVFVKSLSGKTRTLDATQGTTIAEIKQQLQEKEGIPPSEARLIFGGKNLADENTLADYQIGANSTMHLILRVRGGNLVCAAVANTVLPGAALECASL